MIARQSTARDFIIGPVLDAGGVAVTGVVVADFKVSKNGAAPAGLNGSTTATHRHTGFYSITSAAGDFDTVGLAQFTIDDTVNSCGMVCFNVVEEAVFDALYAASANAWSGTAGSSKITGVVLTDTLTTYTGNTVQTGDVFPLVSTEIADIKAKTDLIPAAPASTTNITAGTITTVTNLTNLPSIPANWITTAGITDGAFTAAKFEASSLNGKGDWNIGKTGYSLTATTGLGNQTADITGNLSGSVGSVGTGGITSGSFAAGAINNAAMSIDGSELTLIPWNAAWDTEVQSEVADALTAFGWASITIGVVTTLTNLPSITSNWLTATGLASDAVTEIRSIVSGTADSGSTTTMVDAARTEADTDYWKDMAILFTSGTISGQSRLITAFDAGTDTITFSPATTQAVGTNTYEILSNVAASGAAAPTAAAIADAVWDEDATAHQTQGTFGQAIGDPVADSNTIFKATVTDATGATVGVDVVAIKAETALIQIDTDDLQTQVGTAGAGLTNINLPNQTMDIIGNISGSLSGSVGSVTAAITLPTIPTAWITADGIATDAIGSAELAASAITEIQAGLSTLDGAGIRTAVGLASANLDTQLGAIDDFLDSEIAAIKAKTDQFVFTIANQVDANALSGGGGLDAAGVRAAVGLASANLDTQLTTIDDFLDTEVAAIKAKTDNLPSDPADASDIAASFTTVNTKLDTIDDFLDTEVAAIKAKTDNLPSDPADQSDIIAATDALAALVNTVDTVVDTIELRQRGNVLAQGTLGATGNDTTHLHLSGLAYIDDVLNESLIVIFDVSTGLYYSTWITDWVAATDLATVPLLSFIPQASTDTYWLYSSVANAPVDVVYTPAEIADEVQTRTIAAVTVVNGLASNAIDADSIAGDAIIEIQAGLATTGSVSTLQTSVNDIPTNAELATALSAADDAVLAAITALNDISPADLITALTTDLTEDYRATGAIGSVRDLLYELISHMGNSGIVGTLKTITKLDQVTNAKTFTLNNALTPTAIEETS